MASILIKNGTGGVDRYPLGHRTTVIGRAEALPVQILDDLVSRKHMQIRFDPAARRYAAVDMGSRNGVFVNGVRIRHETVLSDHDRIRIGNAVFEFVQEDAELDEAVLHRFKKVGERLKPTHMALWAPPLVPYPSGSIALGRDSRGALVTL
jgi:pSer/pThr/pTyr-binding forkhead associated (FHA) protein